MPLVLERIDDSTLPIEVAELIPSRISGLSPEQVARLTVPRGKRREPLGELFRMSGSAGDGELRFVGDCSCVHWIGNGLDGGRIVVDGPAGRHVGSQMSGGEIEVRGSAGDFAGTEMRGGLLRVTGDAGDHAGGVYPGSARGMLGGALLIAGSAGGEIARSMRRGLVGVAGDCACGAGYGMIAGTLVVGGRSGPHPGATMRRGSILVIGERGPTLLPTFRRACRIQPDWLALLAARLRSQGLAQLGNRVERPYELHNGDLLYGGRGEVFLPAAN